MKIREFSHTSVTYSLITRTVGWKFSPGSGWPALGMAPPPAGDAYGTLGIGLDMDTSLAVPQVKFHCKNHTNAFILRMIACVYLWIPFENPSLSETLLVSWRIEIYLMGQNGHRTKVALLNHRHRRREPENRFETHFTPCHSALVDFGYTGYRLGYTHIVASGYR